MISYEILFKKKKICQLTTEVHDLRAIRLGISAVKKETDKYIYERK